MSTERLLVSNLSAAYVAESVFSKLCFTVEAGELLAIMGGSGTGKSTLMSVLCGFMAGTSGSIRVDDQLITDNGLHISPPQARRMGLMFQNYALFPHMTVAENVAFGIRKDADVESRVRSLLAFVDLDGFEERSINSLSGGQKQRVALVRALAPRPSVLLLDEPFANLDAEIRRPIASLLKRVIRQEGIAAVMVTHDHQDALRLADKVAVLGGAGVQGSGLLQIDTPENIFWSPQTASVAALTGEAVFVNATAVDRSVRSIFGDFPNLDRFDGRCVLMVRPQTIEWVRTAAGAFKVTDVYFCGPGYGVEVCSENERFHLHNVIGPPKIEERLALSLTRPPVIFNVPEN